MTFVDVLEEFVAASRLGDRHRERWHSMVAEGQTGEEIRQSVESIRQAYRARNTCSGLCRSCSRPRVEGLKVCAHHRDLNRQRMQRVRDRAKQ